MCTVEGSSGINWKFASPSLISFYFSKQEYYFFFAGAAT